MLQRLTRRSSDLALGVNQVLDLQCQLNIIAAIKPLAGAALVGLELRKLRLPKAQDIGFDAADARHIANFEVEAVGDQGRIGSAILGKLHGHSKTSRRPQPQWEACSRESIGPGLHEKRCKKCGGCENSYAFSGRVMGARAGE